MGGKKEKEKSRVGRVDASSNEASTGSVPETTTQASQRMLCCTTTLQLITRYYTVNTSTSPLDNFLSTFAKYLGTMAPSCPAVSTTLLLDVKISTPSVRQEA